jgi:hypothetical protein
MGCGLDIELTQGITLRRVLRWAAPPLIYKPITAIVVQGAPVITATAHGATDGAQVAVVGVKGMTDINATNWPLRAEDFRKATVKDADTIELNSVLATEFRPYISGGFVVYYTPVDLTGITATLTVRDKVGGTVLLVLDSHTGGVVLDNTAKTITLVFDAVTTALQLWKRGIYELNLVNGADVTLLASGDITVAQE